MTPPAIRLADLTLGYGRHPAVHHLDGVIAPGSLTAVVGPNGAGKSTLLKGIGGSLAPLGGRVERGGLDPRAIAHLPQAAEIDRRFPINALDLVATGLVGARGLFGGLRRADVGRALGALEAVGLAGFERRSIGTLSGGQLQRALFARLLLQDAAVILLDEPFTAVDSRTTADLLALVRRWHGEGRTVLAVLHDHALVREHFPEALLLARRPVAWGPTAGALSPANLLAARRMTEAFDDEANECAGPAHDHGGHGHGARDYAGQHRAGHDHAPHLPAPHDHGRAA